MSSRFNFFFTEALRSLSTNLATSIAATLSMLVALLVVGSMLVVMSHASGEARSIAQDAGRVKVFLKNTATAQQVNDLRTQAGKDSDVKDSTIVYYSKDDALEKAKKRFKKQPELIKNLKGNPFPASVEFELHDPELVDRVAKRFDGQPGVDSVGTGGEDAEKAIRVAKWFVSVLAVVGLLLVVAGTFLVSNTIRLSIFARRREIEVMKLVGASNSFVRLPFMIEGFLCGLVAAVGAVALMTIAGLLLGNIISELVGSLDATVATPVIFLGVLAMGVALGGFGSGLTIRKYLRV